MVDAALGARLQPVRPLFFDPRPLVAFLFRQRHRQELPAGEQRRGEEGHLQTLQCLGEMARVNRQNLHGQDAGGGVQFGARVHEHGEGEPRRLRQADVFPLLVRRAGDEGAQAAVRVLRPVAAHAVVVLGVVAELDGKLHVRHPAVRAPVQRQLVLDVVLEGGPGLVDSRQALDAQLHRQPHHGQRPAEEQGRRGVLLEVLGLDVAEALAQARKELLQALHVIRRGGLEALDDSLERRVLDGDRRSARGRFEDHVAVGVAHERAKREARRIEDGEALAEVVGHQPPADGSRARGIVGLAAALGQPTRVEGRGLRETRWQQAEAVAAARPRGGTGHEALHLCVALLAEGVQEPQLL